MRTCIVLTALFCFSLKSVHAQNNFRLFTDYDKNAVDSSRAIFYTIFKDDNDTVKRSGTMETYFMNGQLLKKVNYSYTKEHARYEKEVYYFANGKVASVSSTFDGNLDGELLFYFPSGKIMKKAVYEKNRVKSEHCYTSKGKDTTCYEITGRIPTFPGGKWALDKFFKDNMDYPKDKAIKGIVQVGIVVDRMGNITQTGIVNSVDPAIDAEALRLIRKLPKWDPGFQADQLLPKYYLIPIKFGVN